VYQQLPNVLNLAAAGQMDIADAAQVVGAVQKQFGKDASNTGEIVDILVQGVSQLGNGHQRTRARAVVCRSAGKADRQGSAGDSGGT
jgi:hypothetical protein